MRFLLVFIASLAACAPLEGEWSGVEPASRTETFLSLRPDASYTLRFAPPSGPRVTLEGRYSLPAADALVLTHARLVVDDATNVIVSEDVAGELLCAPLGARELCLPVSQQLTARFEDESLHIGKPPFAFMASELLRR